ncbi:MAG: adenosylcobinamide-GDP ribazoletransferase [Clostridiales bacterium]|nr:adenosylcobinamide-GDP ribazoletransferase [Clostridiales bacterium]
MTDTVMRWLESIAAAFAMYSGIPVPQVKWTKENMRYALCFFPLVGAVIGVLVWLWCLAAQTLGVGSSLRSAVCVLIPVLVSGGIHLDGLLDTADALSSWQTNERRLEILKDPHAGAFAVIAGCAYFLAAFGIWSEADVMSAAVLGWGFALSRALSGFGICSFPCAKESGLAAAFAGAADRRRCRICLMAEAAACVLGMAYLDWQRAILAAAAAILVCLLCRRMALRRFGGITGDIQGFFLQICELVMAYAVILYPFIKEAFIS